MRRSLLLALFAPLALIGAAVPICSQERLALASSFERGLPKGVSPALRTEEVRTAFEALPYDPAKLAGRITNVEAKTKWVEEGGARYLVATSDVHGLVEIPYAKMAAVLSDEGNPRWIPNLAKATTYATVKGNPGFIRIRHLMSFRFLFFGNDYDYTINYWYQDSGDEFGAWWNMQDSHDGQFKDIFGSWYIKKVRYNGKDYIYLRNRIESHFARDFLGLQWALDTFAAENTQKAALMVAMEAMRRK
jgi:hypothetical protein